MRIGIVLPIYRQQPSYLTACIDSLEEQSYRQFKLVIVLDGSDESTSRAVLERTKRLSVSHEIIRRDDNRGIAFSLNEGFARLQDCPLLTWVSSDNRYDPGFLGCLANDMLLGDEKTCLVYSLFRYIDARGLPRTNPAADRDPMTYHMNRPKRHILQSSLIGPSFLFTRDAYNRAGGYDPRYEHVEDYEFWLRLSEVGEFRFVPEFLMDYRLNGPYAITTITPQIEIQLKSIQASVDHRKRIGDIPEITVILQAFNEEKHIATTIKNVLRQSLANFHLLLIDNGSTDRTLYKMHSFQDPRILLLRLPDRKRQSVAKALGSRFALGEFTLELSGSEKLREGELERLLRAIRERTSRRDFSYYCLHANGRKKSRIVCYRSATS
ncbi:glycosyltransferase family 2 protein [Paenibacillus sp. MBLB4367]|uniref:glycosyltransferase family 2 protein n=1 Tax=Paenibacillus sp. MBLB4367 TaxID=3384767 RepID=UPI0039083AF8